MRNKVAGEERAGVSVFPSATLFLFSMKTTLLFLL